MGERSKSKVIDQLGKEVMSAKAQFGQIFESEGVEGENRWLDGGEVEIHRFEAWIGRDDVKDPVQGQVECG